VILSVWSASIQWDTSLHRLQSRSCRKGTQATIKRYHYEGCCLCL